jgi:GNAT superfamily N-acetyltransferase
MQDTVRKLDANSELARQIELAQADQNRAFVQALAAADPASGASSLAIGGGWSNFAGPDSPLSQAQALGFEGALDSDALDAIERHLGQRGGQVRVELTPYADSSLAMLLAARRYRVFELQQVLARWLEDEWLGTHPSMTGVAGQLEAGPVIAVREVDAREREFWAQAVVKGFQENDEPGDEMVRLVATTVGMEGTHCFVATVDGEAAGGGAVGLFEGVATLSGTAVRVPFRGRGLQALLIGARLRLARAQGCELASSATGPGTRSQRNLERAGFRVIYPKAVMARHVGPGPKSCSPEVLKS